MTMKLLAIIACIGGAAAAPALAQPTAPDLVVQESRLPVKETMDALVKALGEKGVKIVARVDHAAGAKSVNMELPPTELLIFGNPQLGTQLIRSNPLIGIDLPMKVLAWQDRSGKVLVAYTRPEALKARYGITGADAQLNAMAGALAAFTAGATGAK